MTPKDDCCGMFNGMQLLEEPFQGRMTHTIVLYKQENLLCLSTNITVRDMRIEKKIFQYASELAYQEGFDQRRHIY